MVRYQSQCLQQPPLTIADYQKELKVMSFYPNK